MAGKIIADQIQSTTAGTLDTKYVVDGSSKSWVQFYGYTGALVTNNSLNVASLTDNGTGEYGVNFSSSFSSANYSRTASCDSNAGTYGHILAIDNSASPTSSSCLTRMVGFPLL